MGYLLTLAVFDTDNQLIDTSGKRCTVMYIAHLDKVSLVALSFVNVSEFIRNIGIIMATYARKVK